MGTKNNPGSFDCYEAAEPDEPMFVLLARDPHAAQLVRMWIAMRRHAIGEGEKPASHWDKIHEAENCAVAMDQWRHSKKQK